MCISLVGHTHTYDPLSLPRFLSAARTIFCLHLFHLPPPLPPSFQFTTPEDAAALLEAIGQLENPEHVITCQHFVKTLEELEGRLKGVIDQLTMITVPLVPDLELVNLSIDHCQVRLIGSLPLT